MHTKDTLLQQMADPSPLVKVINTAAAFLGISSFLGLINLAVGVLSVLWLCVQGYGYIKYELPAKAERLKLLKQGKFVPSLQKE
jgi:hypothetical protein